MFNYVTKCVKVSINENLEEVYINESNVTVNICEQCVNWIL